MSEDDEFDLPTAHANFADHFTDPLYDDPSEELAPFGSDEGADMLAEWADRRSELGASTTVRMLLADGVDDVDQLVAELEVEPDAGVDSIIIGAGFTLLRLCGHIDAEGRDLVNGALRRTIATYGPQPELLLMQSDLASFGA